jgi:hypothetical protein
MSLLLLLFCGTDLTADMFEQKDRSATQPISRPQSTALFQKGVLSMSTSKHSKTGSRRPLTSIRPHVTTGVAGAAMVGAGILLAAPPGAPAATAAAGAELTSLDSVPAPPPLSPLSDLRSSLFGSGFAAPTPNRLASALVSGDPIKLFGNGTNAQPGCSGAACNGGNGGAGGTGGLGFTGGNGGNTRDLALFGSGGAGGAGGNGDPTFTINGGDAGAGAR